MLHLKYIRENQKLLVERLKLKNFDAAQLVSEIIHLDDKRRLTQNTQDKKQAEVNALSREIGNLFKSGKQEEANKVKGDSVGIKEEIKTLNNQMVEISESLESLLIQIPNVPHESVPPGKGEQDNIEERKGGDMPNLGDDALPHWDDEDASPTGDALPVDLKKWPGDPRCRVANLSDLNSFVTWAT